MDKVNILQYNPSKLGLPGASLLYGIWALNLQGLKHTKNTWLKAISMETVHVAKSWLKKNQSEHSVLTQD